MIDPLIAFPLDVYPVFVIIIVIIVIRVVPVVTVERSSIGCRADFVVVIVVFARPPGRRFGTALAGAGGTLFEGDGLEEDSR